MTTTKWWERLRDLRVSKGLQQKDLCDASGIAASTLSKWESGSVAIEAVSLYGKILGVACSIDDPTME